MDEPPGITEKYSKFQDVIACYMFNTSSPYLYERAEVLSKEKNITIGEAYISQVKARMIAVKTNDGRKYLRTIGENLYENFESEYPENKKYFQTYDTYIEYFISELTKIDLDLDLRGKHLLYLTFLRHMIVSISEYIIENPDVILNCKTKNEHLRSAQIIKEQCFRNIYNFKQYINDKFIGKKTKPLDNYVAANRDFMHRNAVLSRQVQQLEDDKTRLLEHIVKQREEIRTLKDDLIAARAIINRPSIYPSASNNVMPSTSISVPAPPATPSIRSVFNEVKSDSASSYVAPTQSSDLTYPRSDDDQYTDDQLI